jgi:hypothetical protein
VFALGPAAESGAKCTGGSLTLTKEKFAEALGYLRNQWDALRVYLGDGRLPIDNKIASYYASLVG